MIREAVPEAARKRLRGVARWIRHLPDRLLHPRRRIRARRRLRDLPSDASDVLFVCYGNICRSPFAAAILRVELDEAGLEVSVSSAGFHPTVGRRAPREARAAARRHGVELADHRSRSVGGPDGGPGDTLVFVMDADQRRRMVRGRGWPPSRVFVLGDFDPGHPGRRAIRDPFGQPERVFEEVYGRIRRCVGEVSGVLRGEEDAAGAG